jgi:hypothetical protein
MPIRNTKQGDFSEPSDDEQTEKMQREKKEKFLAHFGDEGKKWVNEITFRRVQKTKTVNVTPSPKVPPDFAKRMRDAGF